MNIGKRQPIAQIGSKPPVHRVQVGTRVVEEKVPATAYARKMVCPNGAVRRVVLATGRTLGGTINNPYGQAKLPEKLKKGWLLYAECPVSNGSLRLPGETPCDGKDPVRPGIFWTTSPTNPYLYHEDECCKHIAQAIEERQADHNERSREYNEQFEGSTDKLVAMLEKNARREAELSLAETSGDNSFGRNK